MNRRPTSSPVSNRAFWLVIALIVALDQGTKHLVRLYLPVGSPSLPVVPGVLWLTHVRNPGVAFGQLAGGGVIIALGAVVAMVWILWFRGQRRKVARARGSLLELSLALPFAGAVGNLIDRLRWGKVTDFVDFGWFPVFNVADTAITLGAVGLFAHFLFFEHPRPASPDEASGPGEEESVLNAEASAAADGAQSAGEGVTGR